MIVVADTTPLNYLVLIGEIELLPALYENVLIPLEVHRELQRPKTPPAVCAWATNLPKWCELRAASSTPDAVLSELDAGERDAILLALEAGIDTLLMDESEGRREAMRRHLHVTGTVAVLEKAAQRGLSTFATRSKGLNEQAFGSPLRFATSLSSGILELGSWGFRFLSSPSFSPANPAFDADQLPPKTTSCIIASIE